MKETIWYILDDASGEVVAGVGDVLTLALFERLAALEATGDLSIFSYEVELVGPEGACPGCGEDLQDELIWTDDAFVQCQSCGREYVP